ncbi:MAG: hypothetical protein WD136_01195 [Cyanobium sp.]
MAQSPAGEDRRRSRRPQRRQLFCPAHPEQRIEGNGKKYFLHLVTPEQLKARGIQVAHVDPVVANPMVGVFTRREARRHRQKRDDGKRIFDAG